MADNITHAWRVYPERCPVPVQMAWACLGCQRTAGSPASGASPGRTQTPSEWEAPGCSGHHGAKTEGQQVGSFWKLGWGEFMPRPCSLAPGVLPQQVASLSAFPQGHRSSDPPLPAPLSTCEDPVITLGPLGSSKVIFLS